MTIFDHYPVPAGVTYAGYAFLISDYDLKVPLPDMVSGIGTKHKNFTVENWRIFTPRYAPRHTLYGHLTFALKHEGVNLAVLNALLKTISPADIVAIINEDPTGQYSRRIWFLYEWLTGTVLDVPDATHKKYVDVIDPALQYAGPVRMSARHRVRNNLPGTLHFCPLIRRTPLLDTLTALPLNEELRQNIGRIHPDIMARAAAFLLLQDSKASFAIEGETPPHTRALGWGNVIGQAGSRPLTIDELVRLQAIVLSDTRFVTPGLRTSGGFIGTHDRRTGEPIPEHISARADDLETLLSGLMETERLLMENSFHPILAAAVIAFGFVFIHPFEDGNGRIHRYLIHHVLAELGFTPAGFVFPVSSVILDHVEEYRACLEAYSRPRLAFIDWRPTPDGNVDVLNETMDLYRFFDATRQAEFLYACIKETIQKVLPEEVTYLNRYDDLKRFISQTVDMPDRLIDLLISFLEQGEGMLSQRALSKEFKGLTGEEVALFEGKYREVFGELS